MENAIYIRCYARKSQGQWVAVCLNFSLAAQGDSFEEARDKLRSQVDEYIDDAINGPDRQHAHYLMNRRAPLRDWIMYGLISLALSFSAAMHQSREQIRRWCYRETPVHC